jgi:hypothetical protein
VQQQKLPLGAVLLTLPLPIEQDAESEGLIRKFSKAELRKHQLSNV